MPVEEALAAILAGAKPLVASHNVPLLKALGQVLAADQYARVDVPPVDNSAMDGYAFRYRDLRDHSSLTVAQRIPAGQIGAQLQAGTAARIFTGAAIPPGADTVVMQEQALLSEGQLRIEVDVELGQHVRPCGQDIRLGARLIAKGERLLPQHIGLLASVGVVEVQVYKPLTVAVMSTGDELVEPGQALGEGQIYNSNRYTLSALLMSLGCEVVDGGIVGDDFDATCAGLKRLAVAADVIVCSGGVSVGEEDHVKAAVTSLGELALWKLNIKPGKPLAFGYVGKGSVQETPFFGLPGNPSSVFVTFCLMARPFLQRCQGQLDTRPVTTSVQAGFDWPRPGSRQEYLRVRVEHGENGANVQLYPNQSSGVLSSVSWANALLVLPPGATVTRGDWVQVLLMSEVS